MRRLVRSFWILLAIIFLLEAWLWDHLQPLIGWIVERIPLKAIKRRFAAWINDLPPEATVIVFFVPLVLLFPLKLVGMWMIARGDWLGATGVLILAKLLGLGITAFVFDVTRDKLLLIAWFRSIYDHVMAWRDWANATIEPIKRRIRRWVRMFAPRRASRAVKLLLRIRRRAHAAS
jgi:hypothetical protein